MLSVNSRSVVLFATDPASDGYPQVWEGNRQMVSDIRNIFGNLVFILIC